MCKCKYSVQQFTVVVVLIIKPEILNLQFKLDTMTSDKTKKIDPNKVNRLNSTDPNVALHAITELREEGNASYIPVLIELLHSTDHAAIKSEIAGLLSELKHRDAVPLMIEAIENKKYTNELNYLVSACWGNGLDYSDHLSLFIDLMIDYDFLVAFEAHTVITNMSGKISNEIVEKESRKIKEAMLHSDDQKKELLHDLLDFLPVFEQGIDPQSF